jgi:FemAB-related protein (PEP-CTERM system-associated)
MTGSEGKGPSGRTLTVREFDGEAAHWDDYVRRAPAASFCHLAGWREVIRDVLGHEHAYLVASQESGEWEGVLPLFHVRSALFGNYLLSMPFLNYGGAVGTDEARRVLGERAVEIARYTGVKLLELRNRATPPAPPLKRFDRKITVVLDLPEDPTELWEKGIRSKVRSQIRRPQKEGMTARFGPGERAPFYRIFAENMRDLGTPVLPARFFERVADIFPGIVEFGCVYKGATAVAAGCGFAWQGEFEMTWASSIRKYNAMAPNMLLYWTFMEEMIGRGNRAFNFGRCTPGGGTHRFKSQWGGRDEPLPWGQWSPTGVSETPNPDRPLFQLATRVWSRLPLAIANRVGPLLARRLP